MSINALREALDKTGSSVLHKLRVFKNVEDMGGLHVVGTERHESRRIDNQLRGRSGRQGDNGSSRFFLSLEDPLMKMFAGPTTLKVLSRFGMKEGDAIEHPMLTKAVGKAQRKVEERNFLIRKNILEYDEVMDHQRHDFYGTRQRVVEGDGLRELIFEYLSTAVEDACWRYLDKSYRSECIAEWIREHLNISIEPERLKLDDQNQLQESVRVNAAQEVSHLVRISIGEFLAEDIDLGTGNVVQATEGGSDWQGLVNWVNGHFSIDLKIEDICDLPRDEIIRSVEAAAESATDAIDLSPLDTFLVESYAHAELAKWVEARFGEKMSADAFKDVQTPDEAVEIIIGAAHDLYRRRERYYPIDFAIEMTTAGLKQDSEAALGQFCSWVRCRYELDWSPETLPSGNPAEIRAAVGKEADQWDTARIEDRARRLVDGAGTVDALDERLKEQLGASFFEKERLAAELDMVAATTAKIKSVMRMEVEQLERWVLLQILDAAWKEHLHQMDQLREAIGYRSFSQRDPRIEFKREGASLYETMQENVRDRLVDMVFKVRLSPQVAPRPDEQGGAAAPPQQAPQRQQRHSDPTDPAKAAVRAAAAVASGDAGAQRSSTRSRQPSQPTSLAVGRNEPCPCGSGKKYKKCCGVK